MKLLKLSLIVVILNSCATSPPKSPNDICEIFDEKEAGIELQLELTKDGI